METLKVIDRDNITIESVSINIAEAEAYIDIFKKEILICIYGDTKGSEPDIENATLKINRLNSISSHVKDKITDFLIKYSDEFFDEIGEERHVFENKEDVYNFIEPIALDIKPTHNGLDFRIEKSDGYLFWDIDKDGYINIS